MAVLMKGNALAKKIRAQIQEEVAKRPVPPGLAVIIVGNDPASRIYVDRKKEDCVSCGIRSEEFALPETVTTEELVALIQGLNTRGDIHGILCQLPLPEHVDKTKVIQSISPEKDVDGFHFENMGKIVLGEAGLLPCTPLGVVRLLEAYDIEIEGKNVVIVNNSNIVGKPLSMLMTNKYATVTMCHHHTQNLSNHTRHADILITAVGIKNLITSEMVKEGVVVVDIGITRNEAGKVCGDVDFEGVEPKASYITPVPGGVGPMTRAMLMENTLTATSCFSPQFSIQ